jgi:GH25 family lysozyme M1 (1,4-beta-N-acetylmuramidase)
MNIDNTNYCLVIDCWEGSLEINEQTLWDGGVRGFYIRLNDMNGGHHLDTGFAKQWNEAKRFVRAPYFVYNPWVTGQANYNYLASIMPADARCVVIDAEVRYPGYSPATYAGQFEIFRALCAKRWKVVIYTGGGYVDIMSRWPVADYIWARYPTSFYPTDPALTHVTWEQMKAKLAGAAWNPGYPWTTGTCNMWQISDRYTFPGTSRTTDINVFRGSYEQLVKFFANEEPEPPAPQPLTLDQRVTELEERVAKIEQRMNIVYLPLVGK